MSTSTITPPACKRREQLLALAQARSVFRADIAEVVARLNIARQAIALQQRDRAIIELDALIARQPATPFGALARARELRRTLH